MLTSGLLAGLSEDLLPTFPSLSKSNFDTDRLSIVVAGLVVTVM